MSFQDQIYKLLKTVKMWGGSATQTRIVLSPFVSQVYLEQEIGDI